MTNRKENAYKRVTNAAYAIAVKHTKLEQIEHHEWRELENSLSEIIRIAKSEPQENPVGFHYEN